MKETNGITYFNFKGFLARHNIQHKDVANLLGISPQVFSKKISRYNGAKFNQDEIIKLSKVYNLSINDYFFNK